MCLPTELIEKIIDYLDNDHYALAAFSLVSRSFVTYSRSYLWQRLKLTPVSVHKRILKKAPFKSPNSPVFRYVAHLTLHTENIPMAHRYMTRYITKNISTFERFTSIRRLHLMGFNVSQVPDTVKTRLFHVFANVMDLRLALTPFESSSQFSELISNMPELRSLTLDGALEKDMVLDTDRIRLPRTFRELKMSMEDKGVFIHQFLAAGASLQSITNLRLEDIRMCEVNPVNALLRAIGLSLDTLILSYTHRDPYVESLPLDFSHNLRLRNVVFYDHHRSEQETMPPWIAGLLLRLESNRLETVELLMPVREMNNVERRGLQCAAVWLTPARFPNLRTVAVGVLSRDLEGPIRQHLKNWDEAGILVFKYLQILGQDLQKWK